MAKFTDVSFISTVTLAAFVAALGSLACSKDAQNCENLSNCVPPDAGNGGTSGAGGNATGGQGGTSAGGTSATSACSPACSGAKPVCNESAKTCVECTGDGNCSGSKPACNTGTNTCVQCIKDGNCSGSTPLCDTSTNICVQCKSNLDCTSATASLCSSGTCSPCAQNNDCSNITGKNVCRTTSNNDAGTGPGTCVQCTGTNYSACGQSSGTPIVCDSLKNTCSTSTQHSAGLCQTCVSDAQCAAGELCAEQTFNNASVGYFCFYKQGDTTNGAPADCTLTGRPYVKVLTTNSVDGQTAALCTLRTSTCQALNEFSSKDCGNSGAPSDTLCGFAPGADSKCTAFGTSQFRCTVTCASDDDCKTGFTCNTGVNPNVCNL